jgi:hypothetical protein
MIGRILSLFFPSWKLFNQIDEPLLLEVRLRSDPQWRELLPPLRRSWYALVFDPEGNFKRLSLSCVDRLVQELRNSPAHPLSQSAEYQTIWALAQSLSGNQALQFRIRQATTEILRSEERE